jgi:hypothetical protein
MEHGTAWAKYQIENRSGTDVKDKMRNLKKSLGAHSFESAATLWMSQYSEEKNE